MGDFTITIAGIPTALNDIKLRLNLEKQAGVGKGLIKDIEKKDDGLVVLKFATMDNLFQFQGANVIEIQFGNETHQLSIIDQNWGGNCKVSDTTRSRNEPDTYYPEQAMAPFERVPGFKEMRPLEAAYEDEKDNDSWRRKLFVANIPQHLYTRQAIKYHFERNGRRVERCFLKDNGNFGYVTFANHHDAVNARRTAISAGRDHKLTILWDRKEYPPWNQYQSPPRGGPTRPATGAAKSQGHPRRSASTGAFSQAERPQTAPRRQQTVPGKLDQTAVYKEVLHWSNFKELPAPEGTLCVLAQNIDAATHIQTVKMHFESKKRSNGGLVESIVKMIDGLLIVFQDMSDCENCLEMKDQTFDEKNLMIFGKRIPTYFERTFVIEGVGSSTTTDTLTMFLESCSTKEISPTCKKQALPGVYIIEYDEDFDPKEAKEILKNIQKQPLESKPLKASRLLRTDCLKVTGVQTELSSDQVKLTFESKKRTDGGPVTRVDRLKNKATLVYFADYTDAERVYERFKKLSDESIIIGQHPVEVELYFHSLANDHKNTIKEPKTETEKPTGKEDDTAQPKRPLRTYEMLSLCDEKVLLFIKSNQTHSKKLEDAFKDLASVEIKMGKKGNSKPVVKFAPGKKPVSETQKSFNAECKKKFDAFLVDYTSVSPTFDQSKLQKARAAKLSPLLEKTNTGDGETVVVSWKAGSVDVTGLKDAVNNLVDQLKTSLDLTVKKMDINVDQYRIMVYCGIIEELHQKHPTVVIQCDDSTQSVTLTGPKEDINTVQIDALSILSTIEKKKLSGMDEIILRYLAEMLKDSSEVKKQIQDKLKSDGVKAALFADSDDVNIRVRTDADYKKACDSIKQLIAIQNIPLDDASSAVVSTPMWKGFQQSIKGIGPFRVYTKRGDAILAVGVRSNLGPICKKITDFLDENATKRRCLRMPYGCARFIIEKSKEFSRENCMKNEIRCGLTPEDGGGVYVEGNKKALDKGVADFFLNFPNVGPNLLLSSAHPRLIQLAQAITESQKTLTEAGIKQYYEGEEGREFLKMTERANDCIILPMSKTCPEWEREARSSRQNHGRGPPAIQTPQEQRYISVKLPNGGATLQVWKTNIIEHKCDVIINASNPQLQLLPGGVSGVIGNLDSKNGGVIQAAMRKLIKDNYGDYLPGDAAITTAGNLPNCKRIVHAIGPRWGSSSGRDPSNTLKACILKSLQETARARMSSIAIPAVSCGVFGGKIDVCAPLIVEAVAEYFKEETHSSIKTVDFVENTQEVVLDEFKRSVEKYQDAKSGSQQPPTPNPRRQPTTAASSSASTSPRVQLLSGDIASVQADVLVNITSPNGFTSMQGSSVSKALLGKGGAVIQQECSQTPGPYNVGSVFETGGGQLQCQEIFHGLVSHYNQNSKQIVKSIISQCLNSADNAGYSSIAFPAIATGGFKHPPAEVAMWMNQEISNFSAVNLSKVTIVLYPQDTSTIASFQTEFSGTPKFSATSSSGTNFRSSQASSQTVGNFGSVKVNVYQGDITQETSDAIVNSTNAKFDLSQGMVSQAIIAQGGRRIHREVQSGNGADFRATSGGKLSCQMIFHMVTPDNEKEISKRVQMVLQDADQQGMQSLSFPALATGNIGLTSSSVARTMRKAFEAFGKSGRTTLNTINVVVFDRSMLNDFKKGILSAEKSFMGKIQETFSSLLRGAAASGTSVDDERFDLFFYSTNEEAINKAYEAITRETKKMVYSHAIEDDAFERFSEWELWELREVMITNKVKLQDKSNKYLKRFTINGLTRDVMKAHEAVKNILKEFCEAETAATYVSWEKSFGGRWEEYQPRSANILEKAYQTRNGDNTDPKLNRIKVPEFHGNRVLTTTVNLSNLEDDPNGQNPPTVKRRVKEKGDTDVIPSFWTPMQNQPFVKIQLQQNSQEYQTVYNEFIRTGGPGNVIMIERVQNVSLYKQYIAKKNEVKKKVTSGNPLSRLLFHGTADDDKILLNGFDRSYAGKHATAHGRGVYFAAQASYSNHYTTPNPQGQKRMFLADVITGDYCQGHPSYVAPPPRQGGIKNDLHDSVVDNVTNPSIFVIFKDASAYPTHLITY